MAIGCGLRDPADIVRIAGPTAAPTTSPSPTRPTGRRSRPSAGRSTAPALRPSPPRSPDRPIGTSHPGRRHRRRRRCSTRAVVGSSSRTQSGAIEVLLPPDVAAPRARRPGRGDRPDGHGLRRAAPARRRPSSGSGRRRGPRRSQVRGALDRRHAWRLVVIRGRIEDTHKLGDRWRAEVAVGRSAIVVVGQPGVGIAVGTTSSRARTVTVTGIVRPAYPNASDRGHRSCRARRRTSGVDGPARGARRRGGAAEGAGSGSGAAGGRTAAPTRRRRAGDRRRRHRRPRCRPRRPRRPVGQTVRVGGLVVDLTTDGFTLDDGTAIGRVVLAGAAAELRAARRTRRCHQRRSAASTTAERRRRSRRRRRRPGRGSSSAADLGSGAPTATSAVGARRPTRRRRPDATRSRVGRPRRPT